MDIRDATYRFLDRNGMTQKELAALAGVNPCSLSLFLNRSNGTTIAERLAPIVYSETGLERKDESSEKDATREQERRISDVSQ